MESLAQAQNQAMPEQNGGQQPLQVQQPPVIVVGSGSGLRSSEKEHYTRVFPKKAMQILAAMHFSNFAVAAITQVIYLAVLS